MMAVDPVVDPCNEYWSREGKTDEDKCWSMPECDFDFENSFCFKAHVTDACGEFATREGNNPEE